MTTEKINTIVQALASGINELERARKTILPLENADDYVYIELLYMLTNTIQNLKGFIKCRMNVSNTD